MIVDAAGNAVSPVVPAEQAAAAVHAALASRAEPFEWDPDRAGLDVQARNQLDGGPNRARLKLFSPRPGTVVIFLYKDSQIPFSTDRFSYGALVCKGSAPDPAELTATLDYATSGLHPESRPSCLKRALPFTIPS